MADAITERLAAADREAATAGDKAFDDAFPSKGAKAARIERGAALWPVYRRHLATVLRELDAARAQALADRAFQSENAALDVQLGEAKYLLRCWLHSWERDTRPHGDWVDRTKALLSGGPPAEGS